MRYLFVSLTRRMAQATILAACAIPAWHAHAATHVVPPGADLHQVIADATPGDTLTLSAGTYAGHLVIDKPLSLVGPDDRSAIIQGDGNGRVVAVHAADVTLQNLSIRGSGNELFSMDAGIFLDRSANNAVIAHNILTDNLIGILVRGPQNAMVRGNHITGKDFPRVAERGNGIQVWNSPGSQVIDNTIRLGRDGIYSESSRHNRFIGNDIADARFAIHYMYTQDSEIRDNIARNNDIGYALMFSDRLQVTGNIAIGNREHGLMLNSVKQSTVTGNAIRYSEKCTFLYGASINIFRENWFEGCLIGIHFTAGSERNKISGNAFVDNQTQVMYVSTRHLDWSEEGRGNYWSDNTAFDLDGDGIADTPYRPNSILDQVLWQAPMAKLLLNSPATQVVAWAQSQFPAIRPGGVIDSSPLMTPPKQDFGAVWRNDDTARPYQPGMGRIDTLTTGRGNGIQH